MLAKIILCSLIFFLAIFSSNVISKELKSSYFIDSQKALEDLNFFFKTLEEAHPKLLAFVKATDYIKLKSELKKKIEKEKLTLRKFVVILFKSAAFFKDGHTRVHLIRGMVDYSDQSKRLPPFKLDYRSRRLFIRTVLPEYKELVDNELISINGVKILEFIQPILEVISGKNNHFKLSKFIGGQKDYWSAIPILKKKMFSISVKDKKGKIKKFRLKPISPSKYDDLLKKEPKTQKNFVFEFYDNNQTCYYQINTFSKRLYQSITKSFDNVFTQIKEKKTKNLIIDVRFNGGGASKSYDYLLNYLTTKEYYSYSKIEKKRSVPYCNYWGGCSDNEKALLGLITVEIPKPSKPRDLGYKFTGKLFVMTSGLTFSAAADFATIIKDYKIGTILGQETGGLRECFGDVLYSSTPNYKIDFQVSYKYFYAPISKPGDSKHGTMPDLVLKHEILDDYKNTKDPELAFILEYVRKNR